MRKHLKTHQASEERDEFQCKKCPSSFTRHDNLLKHLAKH